MAPGGDWLWAWLGCRSVRLFHLWSWLSGRGLRCQPLLVVVLIAVAWRRFQCSAQGQAVGRCKRSRLPVVARRAGVLMSLRVTVAHLALVMPAATAAARARLNAMTAMATQAAFAA